MWPPGFLEEKCANPKQALNLIKVIELRSQQNKIYLKDIVKRYETLLDKERQLETVIQQNRKRHEQRRLDLISAEEMTANFKGIADLESANTKLAEEARDKAIANAKLLQKKVHHLEASLRAAQSARADEKLVSAIRKLSKNARVGKSLAAACHPDKASTDPELSEMCTELFRFIQDIRDSA